ncbi:MAG: hypothetical protein A2V70_03715 [Planctomycetes bacterium RBG_13_63_9]|nr:MAG: hypothetical protein A2V70_03715 [Planctomycetes bacterium RBG_13_63_9]
MWRRFWSAETGVFLGIWLTLMLVGRSMLFRDPGTFWHTVVGQKMLTSGEIIRADPFSFTMAGKPWVAHQWLAECGMAAVHRLAGWDGLLLLTVTLLAGTYTWVASRMLRAGFHLLLVGVVLALVLLASSHQFHVRPLVLSITLLAATFCWLVDVEAGRRGLTRLWWFVPVAMLWANLHGGVLAGIGTVGLAALGWCLAWATGRQSPVRNRRDVLMLLAILVLSGLAVLVNPYGTALPRAWLITLTIPLPDLIQEHGRLDLTGPLGWTTLLLGLAYLVALLGVLPKQPRISWLLPLVWFIFAMQRVRDVPLFAVTAAIATADMLPHSRLAAWLNRRELYLPPPDGEARTCHWRAALLPVVLVGAALVLQATGVSMPLLGRGCAQFDRTRWPMELLPELQQLNTDGPEKTPIFNDLNFGGFLIYHAPRLRVFVDDRCALYGGEFLQAYDRARRKDPAQLDRWQQQHHFRYALVETDTPFDRHLQDAAHWSVVRRTPIATLYRRDLGLPPSID